MSNPSRENSIQEKAGWVAAIIFLVLGVLALAFPNPFPALIGAGIAGAISYKLVDRLLHQQEFEKFMKNLEEDEES